MRTMVDAVYLTTDDLLTEATICTQFCTDFVARVTSRPNLETTMQNFRLSWEHMAT